MVLTKNIHGSDKEVTVQDYASGMICAVQRVCKEKHIPAPTIVTESGRALVSHHAVLIFDVMSRCADSLQYVLPCIPLHSLLGFLSCEGASAHELHAPFCT